MNKLLLDMFKFLFVIMLMISACVERDSFIGHWRCDKTGTITVGVGTVREQTESIDRFYNGFEMPPLEIEFLDNDTCVFHHVKSTMVAEGDKVVKFSDKKHRYIKGYGGGKDKVMILSNDGEDKDQMTIITLSSEQMEISLETEDDMVFHLFMQKLR